MSALAVFAPAKLNLFLAITGRRTDGFHDLVSVVAPLDFGDSLRAEPAEKSSLECDDVTVPCDETNLVLKAAHAFAAATDCRGGAKFFLEKRIPLGAGLGGGSSDAVAALRALETLAAKRLPPAEMEALAVRLGSDCVLFLRGGAVVMRGRGERVEALPVSVAQRLRGRRVLIFKPNFPIATAWAYAQMASKPATYLPPIEAEARVAAFIKAVVDGTSLDAHLFNNMETVAFEKFIALPALLEDLRARYGLAARMSGSGSACFAFLPDGAPVAEITATIRAAWGESAFVREARLA